MHSGRDAALARALHAHGWLARAHLVDFVADAHWERLDPAWRDALAALTDEQLVRLPTDLPLPESWPVDLRELITAARDDYIDRPPAPQPAARRPGYWLRAGLPNARNMSPKKEHEVSRLAPLVASLARRCKASIVVDVGSGLGYLSHVLAYEHGLHVIGLEMSPANVDAAERRARLIRAKLESERAKAGKLESERAKAGKLASERAKAGKLAVERADASDQCVECHVDGSYIGVTATLDRAADLGWLLDAIHRSGVPRVTKSHLEFPSFRTSDGCSTRSTARVRHV